MKRVSGTVKRVIVVLLEPPEGEITEEVIARFIDSRARQEFGVRGVRAIVANEAKEQ